MHEVCHVEYGTKEILRLVRFYQEVFGWRKTMDNGDYIVLSPKEGPSIGFMVSPEGAPCPYVTNFVHCKEINDLLVRVRAQGLEVVHDKSEVPGMGWFALFKDPDGNVVGLWTSGRKPAAQSAPPKTTKKAASKTAKKRAPKPANKRGRTTARKPAKKSVRGTPKKPASRRAVGSAGRTTGRRRR